MTMVEALRAAGALARTIVVSPDFQMQEDPLPPEPYWSNEGWKRGDLSGEASPLARISSFATVDTLLRVLSDRSRFPALRSIVVTGHSAGGQFTHRYAGASPAAEGLGGFPVRFVVANPSTYLWRGSERPAGERFATAYLDVSCAANLQGRRPYDRGRSLVRFMDVTSPGTRTGSRWCRGSAIRAGTCMGHPRGRRR